ncbi:MAG: LysM peptidoglycan-binding domain-containing protein [Betaproteobacteria bacterium]|nr:LysM peptidoglycan-binding domain-containing protein [Betaproteobacteria bacterium]
MFVGKTVSGKRLAAVTLLLMPLMAHAAGLGRLSVLSQLGQPLNAEIELVSLQPGEEESLSAKIASSDAFSQAGIEMSPALIGVTFTVERKGARPVIRMRTSQPLNEPFLEVLVEVQWASGKLVREYSFLLDPPEYKGPQPIAAKPAAAAPAVKPAPVAAPSKPDEKPIAASPAATPAAPKAAGTYEVKKGDTLGKIAAQNAQPGVTLQQMLVALYRANQDAFIGENINRLRSGRILSIPDKDAAAAIDQADAVRLVRAQSADFADYQQKAGAEVARAPAPPAAAKREASGQISAKPAAKPPAETKDQLKLSKADPSKPAAAAGKAARGDDAIARDRALKEAQSRVQDLEKNVSDLQKLLELKNQQLAEIEKKEKGAQKPAAVAKAPEPAKAEAKAAPKEPAKAEPAKAEAPKVEPPKPEAAKAEPPKPEAPKPAAEPAKTDVAKADAPKADAPKADAPKADTPKADALKAKPKAVAPPPPPPPSVVDQFLDNPLALGGLGGVAALLAGYGAWAWRRKKSGQSSKFQDSVLGGAADGGTASVLNAGAAAPSDAASVSSASVSDASVGAAPSEDVDPIAEADVYMAYGRDAQAEEILKEALSKDANRPNVHAKLLEIYANRRDAKSFEASALKLKSLTGGEGADWDKAAALGRSIDPGNGLYGGSGEVAAVAAAPAAPAAAPALDFDIVGGGDAAPATDISLDLGGGGDANAAPAAMDFDLGGGAAEPAAEQTDFAAGGTLIVDSTLATKLDSGGLDFDLGGTTPAAAAAPAADAGGGMDFDLNLDLGTPAAAAPAGGDTAIDLSSLSLELGGAPSGDAGGGGGAVGEKWQEVATKLDLAKAYEEMGDKDGARDLLNEVMKEGDAAQQAQAQQMLAGLA